MKTINVKAITGILFFIFHFSFFMPLEAQYVATKKSTCDELMKNSYIFEGKIISFQHHCTIMVSKNRYRNYDSYLVEVIKVVKGNIQKGTINLLMGTPGVVYKDKHYTETAGPPSDGTTPQIPLEGLYFCYGEAPVKDSSVTSTNSKSLEVSDWESMANRELKKDKNDNLIEYFPTIAEFYAYISANYGVKIEQ